jgi:hypothetical protein
MLMLKHNIARKRRLLSHGESMMYSRQAPRDQPLAALSESREVVCQVAYAKGRSALPTSHKLLRVYYDRFTELKHLQRYNGQYKCFLAPVSKVTLSKPVFKSKKIQYGII